jgi:hypothetical protein
MYYMVHDKQSQQIVEILCFINPLNGAISNTHMRGITAIVQKLNIRYTIGDENAGRN